MLVLSVLQCTGQNWLPYHTNYIVPLRCATALPGLKEAPTERTGGKNWSSVSLGRGVENSTITCVSHCEFLQLQGKTWFLRGLQQRPEVCPSTYIPPKYPDTFKYRISITAAYAWKIKMTALCPLSHSSYRQSWKHNQGLLHVWAVQLSSFTRSISKRHYWCENDRIPIKGSLDKCLRACPSSCRRGDRFGDKFCFPLTQRPRSPSLGSLFSFALEGTGWKHTCDARQRVTLLLAIAHINLQIRTATAEIWSRIHVSLRSGCPHCHQLTCH